MKTLNIEVRGQIKPKFRKKLRYSAAKSHQKGNYNAQNEQVTTHNQTF